MKINFSVIILTKNRNDFLKIGLDSLNKQKIKPQEILVLDNSPQKNAFGICQKMNFFKLIKYFSSSEMKNVAIMRNFLTMKAKGNYLAFLDDDDYWDKNYLYDSLEIIKKTNTKLLITNILSIKNNRKFKFTYFKKNKFLRIKDFLITNPGTLCSNLIIKKSEFLKLKGFDSSVSGSCDKDLIIKVLKNKIDYKINEKYLVNYYLHTNQWSSNPIRVIKQKLLFYKKYFNQYSFIDHLRMIKVLTYLIFKIIFNSKKFNSI